MKTKAPKNLYVAFDIHGKPIYTARCKKNNPWDDAVKYVKSGTESKDALGRIRKFIYYRSNTSTFVEQLEELIIRLQHGTR